MPRYRVKYNFKNWLGVTKVYNHIVEFESEKALAKAMKDANIWSFEYIPIKDKTNPMVDEIMNYCDTKIAKIVDEINNIVSKKDKLNDSDIEEINNRLQLRAIINRAYNDLSRIVYEYHKDKESE